MRMLLEKLTQISGVPDQTRHPGCARSIEWLSLQCRYIGLLQGFAAAEKQIDHQHCQHKRLLKVQADLRADFAHALWPVGNLSVDLSREYIRHVIGKRRCCSLQRQFKRVTAWYCDAGGATRV